MFQVERLVKTTIILFVNVLLILRLSSLDILNTYLLLDLDDNALYNIGCAIIDIRNENRDDYHDACLTTTEAPATSVPSDSTTHEGSETTRDVSATATAGLASQKSSSLSSGGDSIPTTVIGILRIETSSTSICIVRFRCSIDRVTGLEWLRFI